MMMVGGRPESVIQLPRIVARPVPSMKKLNSAAPTRIMKIMALVRAVSSAASTIADALVFITIASTTAPNAPTAAASLAENKPV